MIEFTSRHNINKKISTNSPKVTVGIPLYSSARFIDTIIANIEAIQKRGVEILISDRHCKDNAIERLKQRCGDDSQIRFFKAQDELDWVGNINFLLQEAKGEYWRFLPHDDISPIGSLEALISALDDNQDTILAYDPTDAIDLDGIRLPQKDFRLPI
ncbi:MAG TPA: glycosyltransferase family A protein [Anaerolineales bacterium]|nr:glycosyltransferase family A protein [Anaerolineales bacterium]